MFGMLLQLLGPAVCATPVDRAANFVCAHKKGAEEADEQAKRTSPWAN